MEDCQSIISCNSRHALSVLLLKDFPKTMEIYHVHLQEQIMANCTLMSISWKKNRKEIHDSFYVAPGAWNILAMSKFSFRVQEPLQSLKGHGLP